MLPIPQIIWHEFSARQARPSRIPEPQTMEDPCQIQDYVRAYEWGGPTSALQMHHLKEMTRRLRPGDTVLDLACGPGPLLLELAALYPECQFFGVDLSEAMLDHLRGRARDLGLSNVTALREDICKLPSFKDRSVDCIVSTSALHHLPDTDCVRRVFKRIATLLRPGSGFYVFDFGLLNSPKTRELMVREVAKTAPALTAHDYDMSLRASFPIREVMRLARQELPMPFTGLSSSFVDFFYFLQTPPRAMCPPHARAYMQSVWDGLPAAARLEYWMLRGMRRTRH